MVKIKNICILCVFGFPDESPSTCEVFLKEGGLSLFVSVLKEYMEQPEDTRVQVETKVLGLIVSARVLTHYCHPSINP